ncbi:FimV/HubP family polar landmark protein [Methylophaga sp. OBS3]|uniref:FimV/HubP family polar landmark protein n=1 Tax=Methylophaga sp. OBS3 TaxID=2991934 RepID=UPI00225A95E6|nr:FimV/HubP family polar landmark protein [Methylophaga sp. OBS3]MCX4188939.1 LysM peptidoglycan-binding domain-containing protein [Methylophaga sp. OBS3]
MTQKRIVSLSVVAALGLLNPVTSWAFGLGQISVKSALNQPFNAEIPVTSLRATEQGNLDVRLASTADFDRAGIDRSLLLTQLRFEVIENGANARIKITSQVPIKEPFLDFLVTASAGEGRMLREYTVLLDPPSEVYQRSTTSTQVAPSRPTTSSVPTSRPSATVNSYQVRRGDTLWQIAQNTKPAADITAQQMMMALLNANPDAFQSNNINSLKANVTLQIPDAATIRQLSAAEATAAVQTQSTQWRNRSQQVVAPVAPTPANEAPAVTEQAAIESASETEATDQQPVDDGSRLKLVAAAEDGESEADPDQLGDPEVRRLNEQLTLAQETIEAQTQENIDFKERMDAMEAQMETMRRLLSLKDEDMARLQAMLEEESVTGSDAAQQPLAALNAETADTSENSDVDTTTDVAETQSEVASPVVNDPNKPAAASYLDNAKTFIGNYILEILLGGLLVLLLVWLVIRNRRQEETWDEAVAEVEEENPTTQVITEADVLEDNDATVAVMAANAEPVEATKTVDELVEQADMFVGYADYVQARTALEQARQMAPDDKSVATKLLFVLFKQNKSADFEQVLVDSDINEDDAQWDDVRTWGLALMPYDARFQSDSDDNVDDVIEDDIPELDETTEINLNLDDVDETTQEEIAEPKVDDDGAIDFDLSQFQADVSTDDNEPESITPTVEELEEDNFDDRLQVRDTYVSETVDSDDITPISLDIDDTDTNDVSWEEEPKQPTLREDVMPISLDLDDDSDAVDDIAEPQQADIQELDLSDVQDDLDFDLSGFDEIDEAETKLDLAAAYVDMGDPDGARGILQEVLNEGSEEQKERARTLLATLN